MVLSITSHSQLQASYSNPLGLLNADHAEVFVFVKMTYASSNNRPKTFFETDPVLCAGNKNLITAEQHTCHQ